MIENINHDSELLLLAFKLPAAENQAPVLLNAQRALS